MEFETAACAYLDTVLREVRGKELNQELRLPEGMPPVGRVIAVWGQPVLRGKQWTGKCVSCTGAVMLRVLYLPENGETEQTVEGWLPFQLSWDLPENCPEGVLRVSCLVRFADARPVTAEKLALRVGVSAVGEVFVPGETRVPRLPEETESLRLLRRRWPVRLPVEAGEKDFRLEETVSLSGGTDPEKILCCRMEPKLAECRTVGNRLVFRGTGNVQLLCRCGDGRIRSLTYPMPFSQLEELRGEYGPDGAADVILSPTSLEAELEDGQLRLQCGLVGQYLVTEGKLLETAEDAYAPGRETEVRTGSVELPGVLDRSREVLSGERSLSGTAEEVLEARFLPELPRVRRNGDRLEVTVPGQLQVLCRTPGGELRSASERWEESIRVSAAEQTKLAAALGTPEVTASVSGDRLTARVELPLEMTFGTRQRIPAVTGVTVGTRKEPDPDRPGLILCRAGKELWDMAKEVGTTVEAIRRANGLKEGETAQGWLLVPVP